MESSQGKITIKRRIDGAVMVTCPPFFVVSPANALEIAKALMKEAGVEVVLANPGQTVIRPPQHVNGVKSI